MAENLRDQRLARGSWYRMWKTRSMALPWSTRFGRNASGITLYTPDGWVSAQLMSGGRQHLALGDWFRGTVEEYRQEASTYIAYSGSFFVDEEQKTVTHAMFMSLFPNWTELTQTRVIKLEGDTLHLSTQVPILSGGKRVMSYLEWRRAERQ